MPDDDAGSETPRAGRDVGGQVQRGAERVAAAAQRELVAFQVPSWLRTIGVSSWLVLGVVGLVAVVFAVFGLLAAIGIPLAIAAVLAAILVPITDRLERWHVPRWLGATLVLVLALSVVIATIAVVIAGITGQADEIWKRLEAGLAGLNSDAGGSTSTAATLNHD